MSKVLVGGRGSSMGRAIALGIDYQIGDHVTLSGTPDMDGKYIVKNQNEMEPAPIIKGPKHYHKKKLLKGRP